MRRDSRLGRTLWPALLVLLLAHAVSDLLHHPFLGDTGDAAIVDPHLTFWVPATEAGGLSEAVAHQAAASLQLDGRPATVKRRAGGAATAVADFLAGAQTRAGDLLVVSSATLADLARDRRDDVFGDQSVRAGEAEALLRRARVVSVLAEQPLRLVVPADSRVRDGAQLVADLRSRPDSHLLAVDGDAWTKTRLGRLVQRAGVPGRVPYRAYPSAGEAALGLESGDADVALVPKDAVASEVRAGRLRTIPWPSGEGAPPRSWTALLEAPRLGAGQRLRLRDELAALRRDPGWRRVLAAGGRTPGGHVSRSFLDDRLVEERRMQRVAAAVDGV